MTRREVAKSRNLDKIRLGVNHEHTMSYIAAESPWLNARFNLGATRAARLYFATTVTTVTLSDLMNTRGLTNYSQLTNGSTGYAS